MSAAKENKNKKSTQSNFETVNAFSYDLYMPGTKSSHGASLISLCIIRRGGVGAENIDSGRCEPAMASSSISGGSALGHAVSLHVLKGHRTLEGVGMLPESTFVSALKAAPALAC
jgi:hypothetical protein